MPKISIVDRGARDYQTWLQPESPDHLTPRSLSSELVLTHEWQPGHHVLADRLSFSNTQWTSAIGGLAIQTLLAAPAVGWIRYVAAASVILSVSATRTMALGIGTSAALAGIAWQQCYLQNAVCLMRPVILVPGYALYAAITANAGAEVFEMCAAYADFRCCEPLPRW